MSKKIKGLWKEICLLYLLDFHDSWFLYMSSTGFNQLIIDPDKGGAEKLLFIRIYIY